MRQHFEEERTRPLLLVSLTMKRFQHITPCIFSQIKKLVQSARIIRFAHSLAMFQIPHIHFSPHYNKNFWIDFDRNIVLFIMRNLVLLLYLENA